MFGFLRKKGKTPGRDGVFADLRQASRELKAADPMTRIKVGMTINISSTAFAASFKDPSTFQNLPREQQLQYMAKLRAAQEQARGKGDSPAALGVGLFSIWLCALAENDDELMAQVKPELATLSREADVIQSAL